MNKKTYKRKNMRKRRVSPKFLKRDKFLKMINSILFICILALGGFYVATVNDLTIKGIKIQELKSQVSYAKERNRNLAVEVASLKSYNSLVKRTEGLNLTTAQEVEYIKVLRQTVAKK